MSQLFLKKDQLWIKQASIEIETFRTKCNNYIYLLNSQVNNKQDKQNIVIDSSIKSVAKLIKDTCY